MFLLLQRIGPLCEGLALAPLDLASFEGGNLSFLVDEAFFQGCLRSCCGLGRFKSGILFPSFNRQWYGLSMAMLPEVSVVMAPCVQTAQLFSTKKDGIKGALKASLI